MEYIKLLLQILDKIPIRARWIVWTFIGVFLVALFNHTALQNPIYIPYSPSSWLIITLWAIAVIWCIKAIFLKSHTGIITSRDGKVKDVFPHRGKAFWGISVLAIIAIIGFFIPQSRSYIFIGVGWQKPLLFEPAKPDQTMLIIAKFQDLSAGKVEGYDPEGYIERLITDKIGRDNPKFPVNRYNQTIISNSEQAKQLLKDYRAAIVIWGTYNGTGSRVIFDVNPQNQWEKSDDADFSYSQTDIKSIEVSFNRSIPFESAYVTLLAFGGMQLQGKAYDDAVEVFNQTLTLDLDDSKRANIYVYRGIAYDRQGKYDLALTDYNKALDIDQQSIWAYNNRGITYSHQGKYDLAMADYNKALVLDPYSVKVYNNRGIIYYRQNQYDLALTDYSKALNLEPNFLWTYINRGVIYADRGKYDLALNDLNKALELEPRSISAYNNRGLIYHKQSKYDLALADYNKALDLNSQDPITYNNRGNSYFAQGNYDSALKDYTKALDLDPKFAGAYANRGVVYYQQRKDDLALTDFTKAIELNPKESLAYCGSGWIYSRKQYFSVAIDYMEKGLKLNPSFTYCKDILDKARLGIPAP